MVGNVYPLQSEDMEGDVGDDGPYTGYPAFLTGACEQEFIEIDMGTDCGDEPLQVEAAVGRSFPRSVPFLSVRRERRSIPLPI